MDIVSDEPWSNDDDCVVGDVSLGNDSLQY